MTSLTKFVCESKAKADEAKGILLGQGYQILYGPKKIDYGTTDMTKNGGENHPYADAWVVIGEK